MKRLSPSESRMREFASKLLPPPWHPGADPIGQAYLSRLNEMDLRFQEKMRNLNRLIPYFFLSRMKGGSGFRMAKIIRGYFHEYLNRLAKLGPYSLPSSFNVVEGFLAFSDEFMAFDLLPERDHLLRLYDYFDWYTTEKILANDPIILTQILEEGVTYSYDMTGDADEFTISTEGSKIAIAGLSLVRHENELSAILLAGENPPNPPDCQIPADYLSGLKSSQGHEGVLPDENLSVKDRYLAGMDGFSTVILLSRLNLNTRKHDVRYINLDIGNSYKVITDDFANIGLEHKESQLEQLARYHGLFSMLVSLIYIPVMFVDEQSRVVESSFLTELGVSSQQRQVQKAVKELGKKHFFTHRVVRCMTSKSGQNIKKSFNRIIDPPDFKFESSGYWKPVGVNEIGADKHGKPIVGKTWVERIEKYSIKSPEAFMISNEPNTVVGIDPGTVYIMRSSSFGNDIYKVGLTRRNTQERATELSSSTGVPLPFDILASWEVGDCNSVEKTVHTILKPYRLNKRREFFCTSLSNIVAAVEQAIIQVNRTLLE